MVRRNGFGRAGRSPARPRLLGTSEPARRQAVVRAANARIRRDPLRSPLPAPRRGVAAEMTVGRSDGRTVGRMLALGVFLSVSPTVRLSGLQCPDGSSPPCRGAARPAAPAANSVAVLYFDNLSPDTTDAYLADGLMEEIASRLGDIRRLLVKDAGPETGRSVRESTPDYRISMGPP